MIYLQYLKGERQVLRELYYPARDSLKRMSVEQLLGILWILRSEPEDIIQHKPAPDLSFWRHERNLTENEQLILDIIAEKRAEEQQEQ